MQSVIIKIGIYILNAIYCFIKLFPIKGKKITFISRQSNKTPIDFQMLVAKLKNTDSNSEVVVLCKLLESGFANKIKYCAHMFVQMYHIATSKVVILDSYCIPVCILKQKKDLIVIQIWHALGSLKKFGYSALGKKDGRNKNLAETMRMHRNYTYILASSRASEPFFIEAFNANQNQMKIMNLPRVDFLQSEKEKNATQKTFYKRYPEANNKKETILYCPTQRKEDNIPIQQIVKEIPFEKYNLIIKLHDGSETVYVDSVKIEKGDLFSGIELLHVADYVITDYSAIVYEAAVAKKPIYLYAYDYEKYICERGIYINYEQVMPAPICTDFKQIIKLIQEKEYDRKKEIDFCNKYVENLDKNATKELSGFIMTFLREDNNA